MEATDALAALLANVDVLNWLIAAWVDSEPGIAGGHEEGGFIVRTENDTYAVVRWPVGEQNSIVVPEHPGCRCGAYDIVLTFHTHPNAGMDFQQEPSDTDILAVRNDPELKGASYLGELVIAARALFVITPDGAVEVHGSLAQIDNR